jgi:hypothetical protein
LESVLVNRHNVGVHKRDLKLMAHHGLSLLNLLRLFETVGLLILFRHLGING